MPQPATVAVIYGSPRRGGNTATLADRAADGVIQAGGRVAPLVLRDLKISPCLSLYGCRDTGRCVIKDDFQQAAATVMEADGIVLASPIYFYTVSAQVKAFMDRCQSLWVKRYWLEKVPFGSKDYTKKGLFIAAGATAGKRLFDGALLTVRYFFDALDTALWKSLVYRGLDEQDAAARRPDYLQEAFDAGADLVRAIAAGRAGTGRRTDA